MKIAVILGGLSAERNVSYQSGFAVGKSLKDRDHEVIYIDPAFGDRCVIDLDESPSVDKMPPLKDIKNTSKFLEAFNSNAFEGIDCAFVTMHGTYGEDGILQSLLELKSIPYTGSDAASSAVAMDKILSKLLFTSAGVNTAEWIVVKKHEIDDLDFLDDIIAELGRELVIKPNDQGSAVGVNVIHKADKYSLQEKLSDSARFGKKLIVEKYISGRELTVGIFNDEPLPIVEIRPKEGHYDYKNKYQKGQTEYFCPAELSEDIIDFTQTMAMMAHTVLGCSDYSRVDFRLNDEGQPYCLEVNTVPGFTELSLFPMAAKEHGIEFGELTEELVKMAIDRYNQEQD